MGRRRQSQRKPLTQDILRRANPPDVRRWFVLDEFPARQRVDCVHDLLNLGRSKGASVLLGCYHRRKRRLLFPLRGDAEA